MYFRFLVFRGAPCHFPSGFARHTSSRLKSVSQMIQIKLKGANGQELRHVKAEEEQERKGYKQMRMKGNLKKRILVMMVERLTEEI